MNARGTSARNTMRRLLAIQLSFLCAAASLVGAQTRLQGGDGYIRREGNEWTIGTVSVERKIRFDEGRLELVSLRNKVTGLEYRNAEIDCSDIRFMANNEAVGGPAWHWQLGSEHAKQASQGELQLDIDLESPGIRATKHYVVYPGTPVIREWLTMQNLSDRPIHISHLDFFHEHFLSSTIHGAQFNYLTGGGNYNGSQLLKTEPMGPTYQRTLDSNGGAQPGNYSSFLPLVFLLDRRTDEGIAVGWDYLGHWRFTIGDQAGSSIDMALEVAGFEKDLEPGASIETPKAFAATFSGGVDALGNQLLDWQYAYMWEFTNPDYFAKTRWAVDWPDPWVGEGGTPSADNWGRRLALDLRYIDLMRETGTDILWDDAGWYDKWGTWNSPDWKRTTDYLRKYGMKWVLWYPTFLATQGSKVAQQHPNWLIPGQQTLEQSIPETAEWQRRLLDDSVAAWGDYQWRYDIAPAASSNDTDALAADQNFDGY